MNENADDADQKHPLPEEIRKMPRDETVCKFCGVSYLIHNEIRALEEKLRACQKELKRYQGSEAREEKLQADLSTMTAMLQMKSNESTVKDELISSLQSIIGDQKEQLSRMDEEKLQHDEQLSSVTKDAQTLREKQNHFRTVLATCVGELQSHRKGLQELKTITQEDVTAIWKQVSAGVSQMAEVHGNALQTVRSQLQEKENERLSAKLREDTYLQKIRELEGRVSSGVSANTELTMLRGQTQELQSKYSNLEKELVQSTEKSRHLNMQIEQFKDQIRKQSSEMEQIQSSIQSRESNSEQAKHRLENDVRQKERLILELETELSDLKKQYQLQLQNEQEVRQRATTAHSRTEQLNQELKRVKGDVEALKQEREMMISAHQNQIEQLRESFKRKMADADTWQTKLDEAIREERRKHDKALQAMEAKLKESFVMELQIEKQKTDELIERKTKDLRDGESLAKSQLAQLQHKHKGEIAELHRQLAENKSKGREVEDSLRREIDSLKKIIQDLENRLGRLATDHQSTEVREDLRKVQNDLSDAREEKVKLQRDVKAAKDEISFLQDTVRRECEERFELTEALGVVKEELLSMKRLAGGHAVNSRVGSSVSAASRDSNIEFYKHGTPQPPNSARESCSDASQKSRHQQQQPLSSREPVDSKTLNVGFNGGVGGGGGGKEKAENLDTARKRIAQLVGRK